MSGETVQVFRVFVSSPGDVQAQRDVLDEVIASINDTDGTRAGFRLELFRWENQVFPQGGPSPQKVIDSQTPAYEVYLGIMSTRFGRPTGRYGSGTEKEYKEALKNWKQAGTPWIIFYFEDEPTLSSRPADVKQYLQVCEFRERMQKQGLYATYRGVRGSREGFYERVSQHLRQIAQRIVALAADTKTKSAGTRQDSMGPSQHREQEQAVETADPTSYLRELRDRSAYIDVRGLHVGQGRAHRFAIDELYISLTTTSMEERKAKPTRGDKQKPVPATAMQRDVPLQQALKHDRLVVVGDPGAGKTTFLRRLAYALCRSELGAGEDADLPIHDRAFPILVRINEFAPHIARHAGQPDAPTGSDTPAWLCHYLGAASKSNSWGLSEGFFRRQLQSKACTVMFDGLDEAPDRETREQVSRIIESVASAFDGCRFVVTSRPTGYTGQVLLPDFAHAEINPLSDGAVETFLSKWCQALYDESSSAARDHCRELLGALHARPDIRRMARNPVMLTALAVVHWNERRLPEQRADLYESIIRWLSRSREQRPGREKADRAVELLRELALAMQNHPAGMHTQVSQRWAAETLAREWPQESSAQKAIARAERFLADEELDSGIIVSRGSGLQFWHRTFQEYLAARAIAARPERDQQDLLWGPPVRLYDAEWRETILLLGGSLHQQGREKVDSFIATVLNRLGPQATLADQARCAGLLGGILRDLSPVDYEPPDAQYHALLDRVMGIFDQDRSESVPLEERIAAADALGQVGDPRLDFQRNDYWVTIPSGAFLMGAQANSAQEPNYDEDAYDDESPVHKVELREYRIARYPLTVGQYAMFVDHEGYDNQRWWSAGGFGEFTAPEGWEDQLAHPSRPVVGVSWYEAAAFCAWSGMRLPTEAEWERAARGAAGRKYPWGDEEPDNTRMNFSEAGIRHPTPVGVFPRDVTPDGVCDMGGNVLEWCQDGMRKYDGKTQRDPVGPQASYRVIRGGCWGSGARYCRAAYRVRYDPAYRYDNLGFRLAAVPLGGAASKTE